MGRRVDGWMDGWKGGCAEGCVDREMAVWMYR